MRTQQFVCQKFCKIIWADERFCKKLKKSNFLKRFWIFIFGKFLKFGQLLNDNCSYLRFLKKIWNFWKNFYNGEAKILLFDSYTKRYERVSCSRYSFTFSVRIAMFWRTWTRYPFYVCQNFYCLFWRISF